jgi:actin related protein 2/3 complex subunit 1A/1B
MSLKKLAPCITCHAWNADGTKVAICPNNNEIHVYGKKGNDFVLENKLTEHDQVVTGIDWAKKTNRIVSCSEDRNAYVWTWKDNAWKPTLVILRINRCATDVKWSPNENKFAVASGAKCVSVCYFEEDNDWWVSKHIKKHRSTVLKVDWHPNNALIATASSDFKCRIFSAFIKGVDSGAPNTPWGNKLNFGELFCEFDTCMGWVQSVRWSPSGNLLAFTGHDSTLCVADVSSGQPNASAVKFNDLPFRDILWISEDSIVGVGHECNPTLFQGKGGRWNYVKKLDTGNTGGAAPATQSSSAFKVFQNKVDKAESATETKLTTKHQNCITYIVPYKRAGPNVSQYSTSGLDGNLIIWDAPK